TGFSEPLVLSSEPAGFSVGDGNVTLRLSTLMTSEPASTVVVMSSDAVTPVNGVTVSGTLGGDVDPPYWAGLAGTKLAMNVCAPTVRLDVANAAEPAVTVTGAPSGLVPSRNWTVPVAAAGDTVAVSVTRVNCVTEPLGLTEIAVVVGV